MTDFCIEDIKSAACGARQLDKIVDAALLGYYCKFCWWSVFTGWLSDILYLRKCQLEGDTSTVRERHFCVFIVVFYWHLLVH